VRKCCAFQDTFKEKKLGEKFEVQHYHSFQTCQQLSNFLLMALILIQKLIPLIFNAKVSESQWFAKLF